MLLPLPQPQLLLLLLLLLLELLLFRLTCSKQLNLPLPLQVHFFQVVLLLVISRLLGLAKELTLTTTPVSNMTRMMVIVQLELYFVVTPHLTQPWEMEMSFLKDVQTTAHHTPREFVSRPTSLTIPVMLSMKMEYAQLEPFIVVQSPLLTHMFQVLVLAQPNASKAPRGLVNMPILMMQPVII